MEFAGIQKTSLIDYPNRVASVLFTPNCNLRCPYCHNWRIVLDPSGPYMTESQVLEILEKRRRYVENVVISGGEPTLFGDLPDFIRVLKSRGFSVKLDSNGLLPGMIEQSLPYLDYVAVDIKTSLERYHEFGSRNIDGLVNTIDLLRNGSVDYEFRCTVVPTLMDEDTLEPMGKLLKGGKRFVFQQFVPGDTLDPNYKDIKPFKPDEIQKLADIMSKYVDEVTIKI